jgi:hypothetical protein
MRSIGSSRSSHEDIGRAKLIPSPAARVTRIGALPAFRIYKCQERGVRLTETVEAKERG